MAEVGDFKFGAQLGFAKTHQKTTPRRKVVVALGEIRKESASSAGSN